MSIGVALGDTTVLKGGDQAIPSHFRFLYPLLPRLPVQSIMISEVQKDENLSRRLLFESAI